MKRNRFENSWVRYTASGQSQLFESKLCCCSACSLTHQFCLIKICNLRNQNDSFWIHVVIHEIDIHIFAIFQQFYINLSGLLNFYLHRITRLFIEKGVHLNLNLVFRLRPNWINRAFEITGCKVHVC